MSLVALLAPSGAGAWPVDWVHDVEAGKEKFVKLPKVDWLQVDDPAVAQAQWVAESHELILIGLKPGRAIVLLGADGKVAAWRIRVSSKPVVDENALAAAKKACPDFKPTPRASSMGDPADVTLSVSVKTEACRVALTALFQTDAFEARSAEITFDGAVLQTQLKNIQAAIDMTLKKHVITARYIGAGLVLEGPKLTDDEYRRVLFEVLKHSLGRFALDARLEEEP